MSRKRLREEFDFVVHALVRLTKGQERIMTQNDALTASVDTLLSNVAALDVAVQAGLKAIADGIAAGDNPAVAAALAKLSLASSTIASDTAKLTAAETPAPAPAPDTAPAAAPDAAPAAPTAA